MVCQGSTRATLTCHKAFAKLVKLVKSSEVNPTEKTISRKISMMMTRLVPDSPTTPAPVQKSRQASTFFPVL